MLVVQQYAAVDPVGSLVGVMITACAVAAHVVLMVTAVVPLNVPVPLHAVAAVPESIAIVRPDRAKVILPPFVALLVSSPVSASDHVVLDVEFCKFKPLTP